MFFLGEYNNYQINLDFKNLNYDQVIQGVDLQNLSINGVEVQEVSISSNLNWNFLDANLYNNKINISAVSLSGIEYNSDQVLFNIALESERNWSDFIFSTEVFK